MAVYYMLVYYMAVYDMVVYYMAVYDMVVYCKKRKRVFTSNNRSDANSLTPPPPDLASV